MTLLGRYGQLAATLARMLELARARQWAQLPALDAECHALAQRLRELPAGELSLWEGALVRALASRIRADQDALAALVRPQFEDLVRRLQALENPG